MQLAFKLPTFVNHFECFVFLRHGREHLSTGPGPGVVLLRTRMVGTAGEGPRHDANSPRRRGRARRRAYWRGRILDDAHELRVPVIWWEDLFTDPRAVLRKLSNVVELDVDGLTLAIMKGIAARGTVKGD